MNRFISAPQIKSLNVKDIVLTIGYIVLFSALSFGVAFSLKYIHSQSLWSSSTRYAMKGGIATVNPLFIQPYTVEQAVSNLLFRSLFTYDSDNKITGDLAESWEFLEDDKVIKVVMAEGNEWSDGEPITASDAYFTFSLLQSDEYTGWASDFFDRVEIAVEQDTRTLTFTLPAAYTPLLDTLTFPLLPQHIFDSEAIPLAMQERFFSDPVTSGDYRLTSYSQSLPTDQSQWQQFSLRSINSAKEFEIRLYPTYEDIRQALQYGDVDGYILTEWWERDALLGEHNLTETEFDLYGHNYVLMFNQEREIPIDIRKAVRNALNKDELPGSPASGPIPAFSPFWSEQGDLRVNFDSAIASERLGGKELTIATIHQPEMRALLSVVKVQLESYGAVVKEFYLSPDEFSTKVLSEHDFDIALVRQYIGLDPDVYSFWHSSQIDAPGLNIVSLKNRRVDNSLEEGRTTSSFDERKRIYAEFQQYFLEDYPAVFLTHPPVYIFSRQKIEGIEGELDMTLSDILRRL